MEPILFASPERTVTAFIAMVQDGTLLTAWRQDLVLLFTALVIAAVTGVAMAIILGRFRVVDQLLEPIVNGVFMTPKIALLPIIALWLGFQLPAKIVVVWMFGFFDVFFIVRSGLRAIDADYVQVARAYCLPERALFRYIMVPASLPYIVTGLRLGLLHGMVGLVLAGFFLESNGIGGLISNADSNYDMASVFAILLTVAVFAAGINSGLRLAQSRIAPWSQREPA